MFNKYIKMICQNVSYYICILIVFATVSFLYDPIIAIIEFAVISIISIFYFKNISKKKKSLEKFLESAGSLEDTIYKDPLSKFPMPAVILESGGKIVWSNNAFSNMVNDDNIYNITIDEYIPQLNIDEIDFENSHISKEINYNGRQYHVFGNISSISVDEKNDDKHIILYWNDITNYNALKIQHEDEKFVSCVIVVDNYEELMQDTPNQDKPMLTATIEEVLQKFAQDADGILRKYEKDRFFFYFQKKYLNKFIKNKFKILDDFKEILAGNKIPPTLSIGIGVDGESMSVNDNFSFSALDMAFGRGGDQAIIKDNENFHFYGGKSTVVEKRTRVRSRVVAYAIRELVNDADTIFIMGHARADMDVLGASLGLYRAIKSLGKNAYIIIDRENTAVSKYIQSKELEYKGVFISKHTALDYADSSSLVFVVDTHKKSLVEEPELLDISKNIVVIDHHRRGADFIENPIILYHEPYASSASELVTEVLQYIDTNIKLSQYESEALYAGIYMDTKSFTFKTGVRTFEAASYLRGCGVDTIKIKKLFQVDIDSYKKKINIIENAIKIHDTMAVATCKKNDSDMQTIVAQATDEMLNISDVTASFVICDMGDSINISARSLGSINVQVILEKLGGGGHMTIAGAQLKNTLLEEAEEKLYNAINEYLDNK